MGKDMQRALLWAILFTSCFLLWDNYQVYKGEKSFFHTEAVERFAALVQTDIKRVLAYSTMSQIGYMFLALGVQAWDAAIFHLMTHAFFKALLFLSSGSVILPAITNRTSSRWAACANPFRWCMSASWWGARRCPLCRLSPQASSVRMRFWRARWPTAISI